MLTLSIFYENSHGQHDDMEKGVAVLKQPTFLPNRELLPALRRQ